MKRVRRRCRGRRGASAVEMALLLPLLMLILLGAVDLGRYAYAYIALTNAARAGAEFGSLNPFDSATQANWQTQVQAKVAAEMQPGMDADSGFGPSDLHVTPTRYIDAGGLWRVQVQATYPFATILNWPGIPHQMTLSRTVQMRGVR